MKPTKRIAILGFPDDAACCERALADEGRIVRVAADPDELAAAVEAGELDEVALCNPKIGLARQLELADGLLQRGVDVALLRAAVPHGIEGLGLIRKHVGDRPLLFLPARRIGPRVPPAKRLFDIVFSAVVLLLGLPLWLFVAAAVKLQDRGPVLFTQERAGGGGKHFRFVKFRTMSPGADRHHAEFEAQHREDGHLFKLRDDPRRTAVGRVLRRFSLDEVPQFLHALAGQMSVVGPRPPLPAEVQRYQPWHHLRLRGWVGLTGLWQVCGRSEIRNLDDIVLLDALYLHNHSLLLDLRIILRTIHVIFSRHGAY